MTNPLNCLHTRSQLESSKDLVAKYRIGAEPPGTTGEQVGWGWGGVKTSLKIDCALIASQVRYAMKLYASSFHPDTGELQNVFGRMSFQVAVFFFVFLEPF